MSYENSRFAAQTARAAMAGVGAMLLLYGLKYDSDRAAIIGAFWFVFFCLLALTAD